MPGIPIYLCPADGASSDTLPLIGTNYSGNSGVWLLNDMRWDGTIVPWVQMSNEPVQIVRRADITDGLSNTSTVSETLRADGSYARLRAAWYTPSSYSDIDALAQVCRAIPANPQASGWRGDPFMLGTPWTSASITGTLYNHVLTPNEPTCCNGGGVPEAAATAASMHSGGVNTLFGDGSVRFVVTSVSIVAWRAFASRDGGELQ